METRDDASVEQQLNEWLHDADRAQGGADMAAMMGDRANMESLRARAITLYRRALDLDPEMQNDIWDEDGNRDRGWLRRNGLAVIADRKAPQ